MTNPWHGSWLVAGTGLHRASVDRAAGSGLFGGTPNGPWERIGKVQATPFCLLRQQQRLVIGADHGLWEYLGAQQQWRQLHDETITEIMALAAIPGDPGVLVATPYGLARGRRDELGAARWSALSDSLPRNRRFSCAVLPLAPQRWLVGTEDGLLLAQGPTPTWESTALTDTPVRALLQTPDGLWAGTDNRGIWHSPDGAAWAPAGETLDRAVYALTAADGRIVAATQSRLVVGDGSGPWHPLGPQVLFATVGVDPADPARCWLAGATPGGLWHTSDGGQRWRQVGPFKHVRALLPPETNQ
ncbi:MAG: hypothetical protein GKR89_09760 [Candidatus Latescibacteria bacterium]|nr:hypothetical protein [Candidatus Latescibacterota bacterium]